MITQIEDLNKDCVKISRPYLLILSDKYAIKKRYGRIGPSKSFTVSWAGMVHRLNYSPRPQMVMEIYLIFLHFFQRFYSYLNVVEVTHNRNFVRFAHL